MQDHADRIGVKPEELLKKGICPDCGRKLSETGNFTCSALHGYR